MAADGLHIEHEPSAAEIAALEEELYQYNVARTGHTDGQVLGMVIRDADGQLAGGLSSTTWAGWLDIRLLWVREDRRRQGLGSRLLAAAEAEAVRRGCRWAIVDTHSFQAPAFYQRHGYTLYATLDGYPPGHSKQYFKKSLQAPATGADTPS